MESGSIRSGNFVQALPVLYLLGVVWLIMVLVAQPWGNFPLNDDWAYAYSVEKLVTHNKLAFSNWPAMTLISQFLLGSGICKIFGFSFITLRVLTLFVGLAGVWCSYKVLKTYCTDRPILLLCSALIVVNPLYFSLSGTFMTDVYFFTGMAASLFFYGRWYQSEKNSDLIIGSGFALFTTLIRQTGIILPLAFAVGYFFVKKDRSYRKIFFAVIGFVVVFLAYLVINYWLSHNQLENKKYVSFGTMLASIDAGKIAEHAFYRIGSSGHLFGLFLFPLILLCFSRITQSIRFRENLPAVVLSLLFCIPLIREWTAFPGGNIFYNLGLGPKTLRDTELLHLNLSPALGTVGLTILRVISFAGGLMFFYCFFTAVFKRMSENHSPATLRIRVMSSTLVFLFFAAFTLPDFFFDRYLLQLLLPILVLFILLVRTMKSAPKWTRNLAVIYTIGLCFFSILGTHDYLAWNRARWEGLNFLTSELKISPHEIDGGFEFNGWYQTGPVNQGHEKSWWFVEKDRFMVTFGPVPGYKIIKKFSYQQYLPPKKGTICVLEKN